MPGPSEPRWCREPGCPTSIILARRAGTGTPARWVPLEARPQHAEQVGAVGCLVVVAGTAWRPADLVEHFMTRFEISEPKAQELAADYPHHRPHIHPRDTRITTEKGTTQ